MKLEFFSGKSICMKFCNLINLICYQHKKYIFKKLKEIKKLNGVKRRKKNGLRMEQNS